MSITYDLTSGTIETKIDLLDRQPFINKMLQIAETLSKSKKNACYALNGAWGVGKSFVINEFEKQIVKYGQDDTTLDRFLLFHYDCWKYDYYAEPLTAIIAVMLETIEHDVLLLSEDTKLSIISTLKAVGIYALDHFDKHIERKTGISPTEVYEAIVNAKSDILTQIEENHEFDSYYAINATLNRLRESITQLAEHQTILLVVDELDRCLPEYTIKVLERLHHVFEGIPNVQIILATDKKQLGHVVRQIYGDETKVEKYLEKFIQFELSLNTGTVNDSFHTKFSTYSNRFEPLNQKITLVDADEFRTTIFEGVDIRVQISLIERCHLIHDLIVGENEKMDISIMCMELFLALLRYHNLINPNPMNEDWFLTSNFELNRASTLGRADPPPTGMEGLAKLSQFYAQHHKEFIQQEYNHVSIDFWTNHSVLYSFILGIFRRLFQIKNDSWCNDFLQMYTHIVFAEKFWSMLEFIH